jgi:GNAT superfamily N-acetyltransferase
MSDPAITVSRLSPARRDDYLAFFDHEHGPAFADNPAWAKCYCHFYEVPVAIDWPSLDGAANRLAMDARVSTGEMDGYLAHAGGEMVGWLNAQPRHKLPHCFARMHIEPPPIDVAEMAAAVIVCFVIAPAWRQRGVARALLAGALADMAERGIRIVDAFPFNAGDSTDATDHYHGPRSLFDAAGFEQVAALADLTIVRKRL